MTARELIKKYIAFFVARGHIEIPGASLVPEETDSSALFTSAGMHPLVRFLLGEPHSAGRKLVDVQKCLRTQDIEEVGNPMHNTFFLMLGNWSLGDYFKEEAISLSWEFLTQELQLDPNRLSVTVFAGDENAPRDEESAAVWRKMGIPDERIYFLPQEDNWWEAGETGPCGPDTEMFYDTGKEACGPDCRPGCHCGKYFEIWNNVFMEFNRCLDGIYEPLAQKNVDTGMGVERTVAMLQGKDDVYETELFQPIIKRIEELSGRNYTSVVAARSERRELKFANTNLKSMRVIADHLRAATFCIADGVVPSNKDQGYIVRRLIRRAVRHGHLLGIEKQFTAKIARVVIGEYRDLYPELAEHEESIVQELLAEEEQFGRTLARGLREFKRLSTRRVEGPRPDGSKQGVSGAEAFDLYQTYGFPLELTQELAAERGLAVDGEGFARAFLEHQKKSRAGLEKKFAGGLVDQSEMVTKYHTATHLLHAALREVLGEHVEQKGSNITPERLRFDFSHPKKMTPEQIEQVEDLVNQKIKEDLPVKMETMSLAEAKSQGALAFFAQKYGDQVKVYSIGQFSKEVCGGPHVESTGELGEFEITKEKSVGRGTRRLRAILRSS